MCIMGLMVSRLEWSVRAGSHLVSSGLFLAGLADELGHRSWRVRPRRLSRRIFRPLWRMVFGALFTPFGKKYHPVRISWFISLAPGDSWGWRLDIKKKSTRKETNMKVVIIGGFFIQTSCSHIRSTQNINNGLIYSKSCEEEVTSYKDITTSLLG